MPKHAPKVTPFSESTGLASSHVSRPAQRSNYGLTPAQRQAARTMFSLLEGSGITPEEAARRALVGQRAVRRITVKECIDLFLHTRLTRRLHTYAWYESKLGIFAAGFGTKNLDEITRAQFREWLAAQPVSASTKMAFTRAVNALWHWAMAEEPPLAVRNIAEGLPVTPKRPKEIEFLTVDEVSRILTHIAPQHRDAVVVSLFAGIRPHEVADRLKTPLRHRAFRWEEKDIRIPPENSKTGIARIIEGLPPTLWAWLSKGDPKDPIAHTLPPEIQEKAAEAAGYGGRCERVKKWPHDAFRHTFATYALAYTGNAAQVSEWLGHEGKPALLKRNYAGLTTKAEATRYFSLRP